MFTPNVAYNIKLDWDIIMQLNIIYILFSVCVCVYSFKNLFSPKLMYETVAKSFYLLEKMYI